MDLFRKLFAANIFRQKRAGPLCRANWVESVVGLTDRLLSRKLQKVHKGKTFKLKVLTKKFLEELLRRSFLNFLAELSEKLFRLEETRPFIDHMHNLRQSGRR